MLPTSNPTRQKLALTIEPLLIGERAPRAPHASPTTIGARS